MIRRRQLLGSLAAVGGTVAVAGCSGSGEPTEESQANESEPGSETDESDADELPGISVDEITFSYGFSSGLSTQIQLRNEAEEGTASVYTRIEAFDGDQPIGEDSTWTEMRAGFSGEANLNIESIGSLSEYEIDDVSEVIISARLQDGEESEIESLTGDTLRERVDTDE
jgi:hypothetical protein